MSTRNKSANKSSRSKAPKPETCDVKNDKGVQAALKKLEWKLHVAGYKERMSPHNKIKEGDCWELDGTLLAEPPCPCAGRRRPCW
jgi:hypothetical protein